MTESKVGRPQEIHVIPISSVERANLPLLSSIVYGEMYAPEMINMKSRGMRKPGIVNGYDVIPGGGLDIFIRREDGEDWSDAIIDKAGQYIHVFQQHDITLPLTTGFKWFVVIEAFYEPGVLTKQVHADSEHDAARIRKLQQHEVRPDHQVICEVDLTGNPSKVLPEHITFEYRNESGGLDLDQHNADESAHPNLKPKVNYIYTPNDTIKVGRINVFMRAMDYELPYLPEEKGYIDVMIHPDVDIAMGTVRLTCERDQSIYVNGEKYSRVKFLSDNRQIRMLTDDFGWWMTDDQGIFEESQLHLPNIISEDDDVISLNRHNVFARTGTFTLPAGEATVSITMKIDSPLEMNGQKILLVAEDGQQIICGNRTYKDISLIAREREYRLIREKGVWRA